MSRPRWLWLAAWLLACCAGRGRAQAEPAIVVDRAALGWTGCDDTGAVASWLRHDLTDAQRAEIEAHEAVHREQSTRWPDCASYERAWRRDARLLMELEAEAYCRASAPHPYKQTHIRDLLYGIFVRAVPGLTMLDVAHLVTRYCGGEVY